jgi:transglutaminase-like putative cysteine protease
VKKICQLFLFLFFFSILNFCFSILSPLEAAGEFNTKYNFRYQVNPNGIVQVNQTVSLTNKLAAVYATKYSLTLPSAAVQNIKASDQAGPCQTEIKQGEKTTTITITFNEPALGVDKTFDFNLSYESLDMAQKNGEVWEINLPKIANESEVDDYSVSLVVPASFGQPAFMRPEAVETSKEDDFLVYRFVKTQLSNTGINAVFGPFQIFDFTLFYNLKNPNFSLGETEIALPPDTAFQKLTYQKIEPQPLNIRVDEDGNWLAKYRLKPHEKMKITVVGKVKIFAQPEKNFPPPSQESLAKNLGPAPFWEVDSPEIRQKAKNLKTPKEVYDFVVKTLNYDFNRVNQQVERRGAVGALANPNQAICMEFADLFVALSRAAGIPAREVEGFAYTTDSRLRPLSLMADVLHAWPEYYDEKRQVWIPVDPTWEKTTGGVDYFSKTDLNHFAFVIHGQESEFPYPAGSYKSDDSLGKDVQVGFGEYQGEVKNDLKVDFNLPKEIFWGENKKGEIILKNNGQTAFYNLNYKISSSELDLRSTKEGLIKILPPFSYEELPLTLRTKNFFKTGKGLLILTINGQEYRQTVKVGSFFWQTVIPVGGFLLTTLILLTVLKVCVKKEK